MIFQKTSRDLWQYFRDEQGEASNTPITDSQLFKSFKGKNNKTTPLPTPTALKQKMFKKLKC